MSYGSLFVTFMAARLEFLLMTTAVARYRSTCGHMVWMALRYGGWYRNYTSNDVNYTSNDVNYVSKNVYYIAQDVYYMLKDINFTPKDLNYTSKDVNYMLISRQTT